MRLALYCFHCDEINQHGRYSSGDDRSESTELSLTQAFRKSDTFLDFYLISPHIKLTFIRRISVDNGSTNKY